MLYLPKVDKKLINFFKKMSERDLDPRDSGEAMPEPQAEDSQSEAPVETPEAPEAPVETPEAPEAPVETPEAAPEAAEDEAEGE